MHSVGDACSKAVQGEGPRTPCPRKGISSETVRFRWKQALGILQAHLRPKQSLLNFPRVHL